MFETPVHPSNFVAFHEVHTEMLSCKMVIHVVFRIVGLGCHSYTHAYTSSVVFPGFPTGFPPVSCKHLPRGPCSGTRFFQRVQAVSSLVGRVAGLEEWLQGMGPLVELDGLRDKAISADAWIKYGHHPLSL